MLQLHSNPNPSLLGRMWTSGVYRILIRLLTQLRIKHLRSKIFKNFENWEVLGYAELRSTEQANQGKTQKQTVQRAKRPRFEKC